MTTNWYEIWADENHALPRLLLVRPTEAGCEVRDPSMGNRRVFDAPDYGQVCHWLIEKRFRSVGRSLRSTNYRMTYSSPVMQEFLWNESDELDDAQAVLGTIRSGAVTSATKLNFNCFELTLDPAAATATLVDVETGLGSITMSLDAFEAELNEYYASGLRNA